MSWLSSFFRKDSVKQILNFGKMILRLLLGKLADDLQRIAMEEVQKAEQSGKSGSDKYRAAYEAIKNRLPAVKEAFINHAIETAVLALLAAKK